MADKDQPKAVAIDSVVLKGTAGDKIPAGVREVEREMYNLVAVAGGFFNPATEATDFTPALDLKGLRILRDDPKVDDARRQGAGDRLKEIETILK